MPCLKFCHKHLDHPWLRTEHWLLYSHVLVFRVHPRLRHSMTCTSPRQWYLMPFLRCCDRSIRLFFRTWKCYNELMNNTIPPYPPQHSCIDFLYVHVCFFFQFNVIVFHRGFSNAEYVCNYLTRSRMCLTPLKLYISISIVAMIYGDFVDIYFVYLLYLCPALSALCVVFVIHAVFHTYIIPSLDCCFGFQDAKESL